MPLEARKYLFDIQQAIELIDGFCADKSFADYQRDPMLRSAVERQFESGVWSRVSCRSCAWRSEISWPRIQTDSCFLFTTHDTR